MKRSLAVASVFLLCPLSAGYAQDIGGLGPKESKITIKTAIALPTTLQALVIQYGAGCLQAVGGASALGGQGQRVVKTGTLKQNPDDKSKWSYDPQPEDRLRVVFADGKAAELVIHALQGVFNQGLAGFANNNHHLDFTRRSPEEGEVRVTAVRQGKNTRTTLKGTIKMEGAEYKADLTFLSGGAGTFDAGGIGVEQGSRTPGYGGYSKTQHVVQGRIDASGFQMTVKEGLQIEFASHNKSSAQHFVRRLLSSWSLNGVKYELNGVIPKSFRDSKPVRVGTNEWTPAGGLLRDGKAFGKLRCIKAGKEDRTQDNHLIVLETPGERIVLEEVSPD